MTASSHPLVETRRSAHITMPLVQDLIVFINLGKDKSASKEPIVLNSLVSEIVQGLGDLVCQNSAKVKIASLPTVQGYPGPLHHLFSRLILNALKFPNVDPLRVNISAKQSGINWQCSIRDNGKCIPMEQLNTLFSSFSQKEFVNYRASFGLGMAICKRAVDLHKGRIWAESLEGEGTVIHFTLPQDSLVPTSL